MTDRVGYENQGTAYDPFAPPHERVGRDGPPKLVQGGHVGVPREGERKCPRCNGHGQNRALVGCERCSATGVVPA